MRTSREGRGGRRRRLPTSTSWSMRWKTQGEGARKAAYLEEAEGVYILGYDEGSAEGPWARFAEGPWAGSAEGSWAQDPGSDPLSRSRTLACNADHEPNTVLSETLNHVNTTKTTKDDKEMNGVTT
jgi:hypothetical protein